MGTACVGKRLRVFAPTEHEREYHPPQIRCSNTAGTPTNNHSYDNWPSQTLKKDGVHGGVGWGSAFAFVQHDSRLSPVLHCRR